MRKSVALMIFLILATVSTTFAQMGDNPVSWKFKSQKTGQDEYTLTFYANINTGWHLYSQNIEEGGPIPTTFTFTPADSYTLIGKVAESTENREVMQDEIFEMELIKFHDKAIFTQRVKVSDASRPIQGTIQFMSCSKDRCNPPVTEDFSFKL